MFWNDRLYPPSYCMVLLLLKPAEIPEHNKIIWIYVSELHSMKQEMVSNLYLHPLSPSRFSPLFLQFVFKRATGSWGIPCDPSIVLGPISHPLTGSHLCWSELYDLWAGKSPCTHSQIPLCFCARPFVMGKTETRLA